MRLQLSRVTDFMHQSQRASSLAPAPGNAQVSRQVPEVSPGQAPVNSSVPQDPKQPQFVGTTRPAFGLTVAEATLSTINDAPDNSSSDGECSAQDFAQRQLDIDADAPAQDLLFHMPLSTVQRLLNVFRDEIEPNYPILDASDIHDRAGILIKQFRAESSIRFDGRLSQKEIHLLKMMLATAVALESHGKNPTSSQLVDSFEDDALRITSPSDVDLQEAQVFAIMVSCSMRIRTCSRLMFAEYLPLSLR